MILINDPFDRVIRIQPLAMCINERLKKQATSGKYEFARSEQGNSSYHYTESRKGILENLKGHYHTIRKSITWKLSAVTL